MKFIFYYDKLIQIPLLDEPSSLNGINVNRLRNGNLENLFLNALEMGFLINGYTFQSIFNLLQIPYEYKHISCFKENENELGLYIVNFFLDPLRYIEGNSFFLYMSDIAKKLIKDKKIKLILWQGAEICPIGEGFKDKNNEYFFETLDKICSQFGWSKNVFFISSNVAYGETLKIISNLNKKIINYNYFGINYFLIHFTLTHLKEDFSFFNNVDRYFICLNRAPRLHRVVFSYLIIKYKLYEKSNFSYFHNKSSIPYRPNSLIPNFIEETDYRRFLLENQKYTADADYDGSNKILNNSENSAFLNVVTETSYYSGFNNIFITEKTWKAIYYYQPFLILSNKNTLRYIKNMGFDIFEDIISPNYDDLSDDVRLTHVFKNLTDFCYRPLPELNILRSKLKERLVKNKDLMYNYPDKIKNEILTLLLNESI